MLNTWAFPLPLSVMERKNKMKRIIGAIAIVLCAIFMWTTHSFAEEVITFEDLSGGSSVPADYKGMAWTNWKYTASTNPTYTPHSGTTSAYTTKADNSMAWESPIDFNGAWFAGASNTTVKFEGYLDDYLQATSDTIHVSTTPQFLPANFQGINSVKVVSSRLGYFAMDDVAYSVVPEPVSMLLFGVGGLTMAVFKRRRK
jgi:hypothetical protein